MSYEKFSIDLKQRIKTWEKEIQRGLRELGKQKTGRIPRARRACWTLADWCMYELLLEQRERLRYSASYLPCSDSEDLDCLLDELTHCSAVPDGLDEAILIASCRAYGPAVVALAKHHKLPVDKVFETYVKKLMGKK
jgi:hypothetical protein